MPESSSYAPGATARVTVEVKNHSGQPVKGAEVCLVSQTPHNRAHLELLISSFRRSICRNIRIICFTDEDMRGRERPRADRLRAAGSRITFLQHPPERNFLYQYILMLHSLLYDVNCCCYCCCRPFAPLLQYFLRDKKKKTHIPFADFRSQVLIVSTKKYFTLPPIFVFKTTTNRRILNISRAQSYICWY